MGHMQYFGTKHEKHSKEHAKKHIDRFDVSKSMVLLIEKIILKTNINPKHTLEDIEDHLRHIKFI